MESALHVKSYALENGIGVERNDDNLAMATHIAVLGLPIGKLKVKRYSITLLAKVISFCYGRLYLLILYGIMII